MHGSCENSFRTKRLFIVLCGAGRGLIHNSTTSHSTGVVSIGI